MEGKKGHQQLTFFLFLSCLFFHCCCSSSSSSSSSSFFFFIITLLLLVHQHVLLVVHHFLLLQLIFTLYYCYQTNFHSYIIGHYIIGDFVAYPTGKSSVTTDSLHVGYILQYHVKLGLNQKLVPTDESFITIDESSAAPNDSSVATEGLPVGYILLYQAKLRKNQKFVPTNESFIAIYESSAAPADSSVATDDLSVRYMLQYQVKLGQNQKFVQKENENVEQDQHNILNDELNGMKINIPDDEIGHDVEENQTRTPIVDIVGSSQSKQLNNLQDDEIGFYVGMTFKNKE
ncbi:hypothetical protein KY285_020856 [Solanum tuberosum]|nr:hypothetical protein KY285_020856 [Solanum tuberosum]